LKWGKISMRLLKATPGAALLLLLLLLLPARLEYAE